MPSWVVGIASCASVCGWNVCGAEKPPGKFGVGGYLQAARTGADSTEPHARMVSVRTILEEWLRQDEPRTLPSTAGRPVAMHSSWFINPSCGPAKPARCGECKRTSRWFAASRHPPDSLVVMQSLKGNFSVTSVSWPKRLKTLALLRKRLVTYGSCCQDGGRIGSPDYPVRGCGD